VNGIRDKNGERERENKNTGKHHMGEETEETHFR